MPSCVFLLESLCPLLLNNPHHKGNRESPESPTHSERRKSKIDCCSSGDSLLKRCTTPFASEAGYFVVAAEKWSRIALSKSAVLPSWKKKMRWPTPHNG